jgi:hypothetical protein
MTACQSTPSASDSTAGRYTFSRWTLSQPDAKPRGGTTAGVPVTRLDEPSQAWRDLQDPKLSGTDWDRQAILAMAGEYETSFEFLETVAYQPDYEYDRPYQSWATELVKVIADEPDRISLQHILVMYYKNDEGKTVGPMVMKHWRQDWLHEPDSMLVYEGRKTWRNIELAPEEVKGQWLQTVYQVDDSPRYQSLGQWQHMPELSYWEGERTWRPLPRREFSVRDDYDILLSRNRHSITPTGWVHEQDNLKAKIDDSASEADVTSVLSREIGLNRYQLITGTDFSAGHEYWQATKGYWGHVRDAWDKMIRRNQRFRLKSEVDGKKLYQHHFAFAGRLQKNPDGVSAKEIKEHAYRTVESFVEPLPADKG